MRNTLPSLSTRTREFTPRELPLGAVVEQPPPSCRPERPTTSPIKDAIIRWLEEEL